MIKQTLSNGKAVAQCLRCNTFKIVFISNVISGKSKGCTCGFTTHGESASRSSKESPEHRTWRCMKNRCHNPKSSDYHHYGARGISVCDSWKISYEQFLKDMGRRPPKCTLDRIDNEKGYFKENCRWATLKEQGRNTSRTKYLTYKKETYTLIEWSEKVGIKSSTIRERLKRGWSIDQALKTPVSNFKGERV